MNINPQNLKAVLYPENFFEMPDNVIRTNCYNIIDYHYMCYRERDQFNNPFGPFLTKHLELTVRASELNNCKAFYNSMDETKSIAFSIIFDPEFNPYDRMTGFKDGMVVHGYVIDILETCVDNEDYGDEQLEIKITLAFNKLSFLGKDSMYELNITND